MLLIFKFVTVVSTCLLDDTLLKQKIHVDERSLFYELQDPLEHLIVPVFDVILLKITQH